MTMYHASIYGFEQFSGRPCFTDDRDAALGYLNGHAGYLYAVEINEGALDVAGERTVRGIARELGIDGSYVWELVEEEPDVRAALEADGYNAVEYTDLGPDNAYEHYTLMVLDPALVRIVEAEEIEEGAA